MRRAWGVVALATILSAFFVLGIGSATPVQISGDTVKDNTLSPSKMKRTGSAPIDNQVPAYDNATGHFRWITPSTGVTPAGSTGSIQYNDNGSLGAIPGTGFNKNDNSTTLPGSLATGDPGDGHRRLTLLSNTSYSCSANENAVLVLNGKLNGCENGVLVAYHKDNVLFSVADNFNRANENPLGNGVWTTVTGYNAMQIVSNAATKTIEAAPNGSYYTGATFADNQYAQAVRTGIGFVGVGCRWSGNSGYYVTVEDGGNYGAIYRVDAGVETLLGATWNHSAVSGETLRIECSGTTIRVLSNGSEVASRTDNTYTSGSPVIHQWNNAATLDNFVGGNL